MRRCQAGKRVAMRRAYDEAGFRSGPLELVEAHGTGTAAGDAAEIESLRTVFEPAGERQAGSGARWAA